MRKAKLRMARDLGMVFINLLVLSIFMGGGIYFAQTHFLFGTKIEGVPCSFLSIEQAIEKINLEKGEKTVTFCFSNSKTYDVASKQLGIRVDETRITQIFEQQHSNLKESREYELDGFILIDTKRVREFFELIPELQDENIVEPKNAYIVLDEKEFLIQKEVLGNIIDFEDALNFALEEIKNDRVQIDFAPITDVMPKILAEDLINERDELNSILKSSINFELSNGDILTLDSNTIKNWVNQDENGKFTIDVENGVSEFVEELAIKVNEANSYMQFIATDCEGLATVNVPIEVRAQLDKEKEIAEIKSMLGNSELIYKKPIYDREFILNKLTSYVEIDISRQHVWVYINGTLFVDAPCVTGNVSDGHATPTGVFYLLNKNRGVYLEGFNNDGSKYSSFVEYWMRFNQGIGMHDATWRASFGGNIYLTNGSHGCVNLPEDKAAQIYEVIDETMPIIVYQSNL